MKKWRAQKGIPVAAEDFFTRWARRREAAGSQQVASPEPTAEGQERTVGAAPVAAPALDLPAPTMEQVDALTHDSDFSRFVKSDVDENIKRSAMKKLFSNPRFNVMDGLDTYIEDYNSFEPLSPAMLQSLNHAKNLLDPLSQLEKPVLELIRKVNGTASALSLDAEQPDAPPTAANMIEGNARPELDEAASTGTEQIGGPALDVDDLPPSSSFPPDAATPAVLSANLPESDHDNPI